MGAADLRDRVAAAAHELRSIWSEDLRGLPWVLSRFGFEFLDPDAEPCLATPADRIAGLARTLGKGRGELSLRPIGSRRSVCFEWEFPPGTALEAAEEAFPVWLAQALEASSVLLIGAGQSLRDDWPVPVVVGVDDHLQWPPRDPLQGWASAAAGPRFPSTDRLYEPLDGGDPTSLRGVAAVYGGSMSPTPAERRALRALGADLLLEGGAVEALAASHAAIPCAARAVLLDSVCERDLDPGDLAERAEEVLPMLRDRLPSDLQALDSAAEALRG